jgi:hypothetical protein
MTTNLFLIAQSFVANEPTPPLNSEEASVFGSTFEQDWTHGTNINEVFDRVHPSVLVNIKKRLTALVDSDVLNDRATVEIKAYLYDLTSHLADRDEEEDKDPRDWTDTIIQYGR